MGLFAGAGVYLRFAAVATAYGVAARRAAPAYPLLSAVLGYSAAQMALVTTLVVADAAPWVVGKDPKTGGVPMWSWVLWGPFHLTNRFFISAAKWNHQRKHALEVATEVYPGWYLGGWSAPGPRPSLSTVLAHTAQS